MKKNLQKGRKLTSLSLTRLEDRESPLNNAIQEDGTTGQSVVNMANAGTGTQPATYESQTDGNADESPGGYGVRNDWLVTGGRSQGGAERGEVALDAPPEFMAAGNSYAANACYSNNNFYTVSICVA